MADFNLAPYYAAGRNVLSAGAGALGMLATLHLISGDEVGKITDAFHQIGTGIASITAGVTTLVGIASAFYAAWSATQKSQMTAVIAMPAVPPVVKAQLTTVIADQQGSGR